mgnify:CR=1 FL=1
MALDAGILTSFQTSVADTFSNASNNQDDEYTVASNLVTDIFNWLKNAEIRIFTPGVNPSGTTDVWESDDENPPSKTLLINLDESEVLRISLEASLVASFRDAGPDNMGQPGLRIFCNQDITEDDVLAWKTAVTDIIENKGSDKTIGDISGDRDVSDVDEMVLGYPYFLSMQVTWSELSTPPYVAAEAATKILDQGESMFSGALGLKPQMETNSSTQASCENAGIDFANAVNDSTVGATVTSMFTNGTFTQVSPEVASIE